jgi:hypothetical protein
MNPSTIKMFLETGKTGTKPFGYIWMLATQPGICFFQKKLNSNGQNVCGTNKKLIVSGIKSF